MIHEAGIFPEVFIAFFYSGPGLALASAAIQGKSAFRRESWKGDERQCMGKKSS